MLVSGLQRLCRVTGEIQWAGELPARRCQIALRDRLNRLINVCLADGLHRLCRRHHLRANLRDAGLRRDGDDPVLGAGSAVAHVVNGRVVKPGWR